MSPSSSLGIPSRPRETMGPKAASSRPVMIKATPGNGEAVIVGESDLGDQPSQIAPSPSHLRGSVNVAMHAGEIRSAPDSHRGGFQHNFPAEPLASRHRVAQARDG